MLCSNCGYDNPNDYRFCGMCGIRLERIPVPQREAQGEVIRQRLGSSSSSEPPQPVSGESVSKPYQSLPLKPLRGQKIESQDDERAETPQNGNSGEPPAEKRPQRAISGPSFLNLEVPTEPPKQEQTISGPSFLGLGDEGRYNIDYLLEDEPKESHWRLWLVLIILGLFGVMAWLQLRHSGLNVASLMQRLREAKLGTVLQQTNPRTGSSDAAPAPADNSAQSPQPANKSNQNASAPGAAAANNSGDQTKSAAGAAQPGAPEQAKSAGAAPDKSNSAEKSDTPSAANPAAAAQPASDQSKSADASASEESAAADKSSTAGDQGGSDVEPAASKSVTTAKNTAPKKPSAAVDDSDARAARNEKTQEAALVANGEKYLYGRGVPQNCERAISYLRKASDMGNAKGSSHLGAMYATGQCLPMDRVRAYKYFAQALHQDNTNPYFQHNLEMLWNEMSADEKQQATARTPAQ